MEDFKRWRFILLAVGVFLPMPLLLFWLFSLQVGSKGAPLRQRGRVLAEVRIPQPGPRGEIYDRFGRPLAISLASLAVYQVGPVREDRRGVLERLGIRVSASLAGGRARLLKRGLSFYDRDRFEGIPGIAVGKIWERRYPLGNAAASLIGRVSPDGQGRSGLEWLWDTLWLRGEDGFVTILRTGDGSRYFYPESKHRAPKPGGNLVLTIDADLQVLAYQALREGVERVQAQWGFFVILNPQTGEILALGDYTPGSGPGDTPKAVKDLLEPGSTFKIVPYAAAFETGVVKPSDSTTAHGGRLRVGDKVFRDAHRQWGMTYREGLIYSSNVVTLKLGRLVGEARLVEMARRFGFGSPTGIPLPGEPVFPPLRVENRNPVELAGFSIGYGISVTGLQLALAYAAVANGGLLLAPRLIRALQKNGKEWRPSAPQVIRRVLSPELADTLKQILLETVERGTGKRARIPGLPIAGKTGTAELWDPEKRSYDPDRFNGFFVGFFPLEAPRYLILVAVGEPRRGRFGSDTACPIFREIARQIWQMETVREGPYAGF